MVPLCGRRIHRPSGIVLWGGLIALSLLTACAGAYGRLQRSHAVGVLFERNTVLADHHYYTAGPEAQPTAILAVHQDVAFQPGLWRPVAMTAAQLARLVDAMTDQLGVSPAIMGGVIMDPEGKPVGLWYSRYSRTTVRFATDRSMTVSLPDPAGESPLDRRPRKRI